MMMVGRTRGENSIFQIPFNGVQNPIDQIKNKLLTLSKEIRKDENYAKHDAKEPLRQLSTPRS
jgi:hypothetical protein